MKLVENINPYIFREYDIRGTYNINLNEDIAYTIGKSFGSYIKKLNKTKCIIAHDNRYSSEELVNALIKGITQTGVDVIFLGLVTTPMCYFASIKLEIPSYIMVTASHNPKDDNGFKLSFDERGNAKGEMIKDFYDFTRRLDFYEGNGKVSTYDIKNEYFDLIKNSLDFSNRKVKVVIDCGNGTTSIIAKKLYEMFNVDLTVIYGDSDPSFPNHHPDPCVESNLEKLKEVVIKNKADLGIGFDGDGDRLGIVDEKGNYIPTDLFMIIIIRSIIDKVNNKTFLYDVKCSKALEDEIIKLGGTPLCYRTGNSYTKAKVKEENLSFGGELSGHVYFRDRFIGIDSALYASLRLVELLSKSDKPLSSYLDGIEKYYSTEELKFKSTDDKKHLVVEDVINYAKKKSYNYITIDGIKIMFNDDSWCLIRVSNTGPNITARFEAKNKTRLNELITEFVPFIEKYINN